MATIDNKDGSDDMGLMTENTINQPLTLKEFEAKFKKYHTCGEDTLGPTYAYSSDCPLCDPEGIQWKGACRAFFAEGAVVRGRGWWYLPDGSPGKGVWYSASAE